MSTINFKNIRATPKSQHDSFEALATLLFQRTFPAVAGSEFTSLRGDGGDGGVEAYFKELSGAVHGVQAKYFFKLGDGEFGQIKDSLKTALQNYPELRSYSIYVPFDLTGRKAAGKLGKSETEKFEHWKQAQEAAAFKAGKPLQIELIGATKCRGQLLSLDHHGGLRRYWFDDSTLTDGTIRSCLAAAQAFAGPRYTETLDVNTAAHLALDFFGGTGDVQAWVLPQLKSLRAAFSYLAGGLGEVVTVLNPDEQSRATEHVARVRAGLRELVIGNAPADAPAKLLASANALQPLMEAAEAMHYAEFCAKHGADKDTPGFRQWHASYQLDFPAANLDRSRDAQKAIAELRQALDSPAIQATRAQSLLLVGPAGIGKTHAIVSAAERRFAMGAYSLVLFGDDFDGPTPWEVIRSKLGFGSNVGRGELFECLDAAATAQGYPVVVFIDALNEGPMGGKWKDRLPEFLSQVRAYPGIKVCVSTRDTYKDVVVDSRFPGYAFKHPGFRGREFEALQDFAASYGLDAEITPLFSEETANPLFLHLACRTLQAQGVRSLDLTLPGFLGLFEGYLELCEQRVRGRLPLASPGNIVRKALLALAQSMSAASGITWVEACRAVDPVLQGEATAASFLQELHKEGLLIVTQAAGDDYLVRFGYQRYGDVLRCLQLVQVASASGALDVTSLASQLAACDDGLLEASAYVLPEAANIELTQLGLPKDRTYPAFIQGIVWRTKSSIGIDAEAAFGDALGTPSWPKVLETSLKVSLVPDHLLNASWLDTTLRRQAAPTREGFLWNALDESYDDSGVVSSLVEAGLRSNLSAWPVESRRLAGVAVGWLTSSPDRRVRDQSTKGLARLLGADTDLAAHVARHFDDCDDEYILESVSSAIYCACLLARPTARGQFASALDALLSPGYDRGNQVIRDNINLLAEAIGRANLAGPTLVRLAAFPTRTTLPASWPTEAQAKALLVHGAVVANMDFIPGTMQPDFWQYEVKSEVRRFDLKAAGIGEKELAFWMMVEIQRLGFPGASNACLAYDSTMARRHGQERGRPGYAERIGKKYSWIALHRLVALLSDNLAPRKDLGGEAPDPGALKYALRLRKADITDVRDIRPRPAYPDDLLPSPDYAFPRDGDDRKWLDRQDLTPHEECLIRTGTDGTEWFALSLSAESDEKLLQDDDNVPYRRITMDFWTVFAPAAPSFDANREVIEQELYQNAPSSYRAYFAEYPREAACEYCLEYGEVSMRDGEMVHSLMTLARGNEWDSDYSWKGRAESLDVPTKALIDGLQLHWDQHSGWLDEHGELAAFDVRKDNRSALFLRKTLLDKYLLDAGQVLYARQFVYRGTVGGYGGSKAPSLDVDTVVIYRPGQGVVLLDEKPQVYEPDAADGD
ncbi:ATP-binding protein [Ramlibacter sp. G-1-2-2]|uniref:ATP-binding protein n=1 Tax=Ramlibacter agri TaxID=2728837 RepID=A0A848H948_9BURK|nr:ATP-binding protein [Ramlibacter agri]NML45940.1 ATP-binding protein [Ramlibacter agri]